VKGASENLLFFPERTLTKKKGEITMSVYDTITQNIIAQLEQDTVPWRKPWISRGVPRNLLSLKPYRGINVWLLLSRPYTSPYWCTFRQVQEIGGTVRKGEKGTIVVFWKFAGEKHNEDNDQPGRRPSSAPLMRAYAVFNSEQCSLPASLTARIAAVMGEAPEPITACEQIIANMPQCPRIEHGGDHAYYSPLLDTICLPHRSQFISAEEY
jgi:antirestriction protein ArdC